MPCLQLLWQAYLATEVLHAETLLSMEILSIKQTTSLNHTVAGTNPDGLTISGLRSFTVCAPSSAMAVQISFCMTVPAERHQSSTFDTSEE
jgi:hypothetical protein